MPVKVALKVIYVKSTGTGGVSEVWFEIVIVIVAPGAGTPLEVIV